MSLRARLTLVTAALIALAAVALGAAAFVTAQRVQLESIDRILTTTLANPRMAALASRAGVAATDAAAQIGLARIVRATGEIVVIQAASTDDGVVPFPTLTEEQLQAATVAPITVPGLPEQRVLVQVIGPRQSAVAAVPLSGARAAQDRLLAGLAASVVVVIGLGSAVAYAVVRRALRPVDAIADAATAVADGDLTRRMPRAPAGTELGRLSAAVDAMIASLTESISQAHESEDRLRRFVSDASHEIRTPLTVIRGYAELLDREASTSDPMEVRALDRIQSESARLERLVTQLLLLERLETRAADSSLDVDLASITAAAFTDLGAPLTGREVTMTLDDVHLVGDPDGWSQVVANLVQNIERHTPPLSPVQVSVSAHGDRGVLIVDDAGPGIPAADRAGALDRFTRLDPSRARASGGFGLGMGIVAAVVRNAAGTLTLEESPLGGLRVRITAPLSGAPEGAGRSTSAVDR